MMRFLWCCVCGLTLLTACGIKKDLVRPADVQQEERAEKVDRP